MKLTTDAKGIVKKNTSILRNTEKIQDKLKYNYIFRENKSIINIQSITKTNPGISHTVKYLLSSQ